VLERFAEYFINRSTVRDISAEDLNQFIIDLMKNQYMAANTVIHNVIIIAQFFKRQGRPNITRDCICQEESRVSLRVRRTGTGTFLWSLQ
jgi:hypothetical protein